MSNNLTAKQEAFVQAYLRTGNQRVAYREAYNAENMTDAVVDVKACELMKNGKVAVRVQHMQERTAKKTETTVEKITEMLSEAFDLAKQNGQIGAAVAASMGMAKLHGLIVEKREDVTKPKSTREIDARINQLLAGRGERRAADTARGAGEGDGTGKAVPTVSYDGAA